MKSKIVVLTVFTFVVLSFSGCISNNSTDNSSNDNSDNSAIDSSWLDDYTPVHSVGTGSSDFWITYPPGNPSTGQSVNHLDWVLNSLEKGCVLFVVHKTGCPYCKAQADRVIALADKYAGQVEFYDLDIPLGGDVEQKANDAYVYDPDGAPGYIALTGVFTLIENNGEIACGWHSWELDVVDTEMEEWVQDAIYYYNVNSKG